MSPGNAKPGAATPGVPKPIAMVSTQRSYGTGSQTRSDRCAHPGASHEGLLEPLEIIWQRTAQRLAAFQTVRDEYGIRAGRALREMTEVPLVGDELDAVARAIGRLYVAALIDSNPGRARRRRALLFELLEEARHIGQDVG